MLPHEHFNLILNGLINRSCPVSEHNLKSLLPKTADRSEYETIMYEFEKMKIVKISVSGMHNLSYSLNDSARSRLSDRPQQFANDPYAFLLRNIDQL